MNAGIGEQSHASGLDAAYSSRVFRRHDHPGHRALWRKEGEGMSSPCPVSPYSEGLATGMPSAVSPFSAASPRVSPLSEALAT
ncbi:MAG: hypothetical protein ABJE31_03965 [Lentilitoribacter sp.]